MGLWQTIIIPAALLLQRSSLTGRTRRRKYASLEYTVSKVWFVTGAGSGIGTEMAKAALRVGDRVVATGRNLEKVRKVFPGVAHANIAFVQLDVANEEQAKRAVDEHC
jgi:NADP-dependent 3-hydroxy acid dehydrogenase YdfG